MDKKETKNRIEKLRDEISRLRHLYHTENNPRVTDDVYESLTKELNELERKFPDLADPNSAVRRVAGEPLSKFIKVKHKIRMVSLNDTFSEEEVLDWENRIKKLVNKDFNYFCELKFDGLSASLIYENGVFKSGATRGDGFIGEDVTENLKMVNTIPLVLNPLKSLLARKGVSLGKDDFVPKYLEVRGEIVMSKRAWKELNKNQEKEGKPIFANTRNAAAGSLRQLDSKIVKERNLDFFAWDIADIIFNDTNKRLKNHSEKHELLRKLGFSMSPYERKVKNIKDAFIFIKEVAEIRDKLPYGTDGVVISVDDLSIQESLGIVGKAPRYMTAFKYPAEKATTILKNITVNVGRTGVLTPVAHFNPTFVAGSLVSKATLHNMDQIERLNIKIGDTVVIQKAGDVIPEVVEVLVGMRSGKEKKFKMPDFCPVCGGKVENKKIAFYCTNKNCGAKNNRGMQHFVNVYEIYEIGPKILERLKEEGLISDSADLFTLERADLSGLERFGEKSADNIINSIEEHKKVSFWRFIYALGIIHVGEQTAHDLADHFHNLDNLKNSSLENLNDIENIGPAVSESIYNYFRDKHNLDFINKLFENGVQIIEEKKKTGNLTGKVFVLTGTLPTLSREDAKKKIIENGGKVSSSVSSNTSFVLAGDEAGSKLKEAQKLGIKIISEQDFLKML